MAIPLHPSPYRPRLASCEVCWADSSETTIYHYKGTTYCEYDRDRAIAEKWHEEVVI
jgi:hypothetical protein